MCSVFAAISRSETIDERQRTVAQQVERADEGPRASACPDAHRRAMPLELAGEQLVVQRDHVAVALEEVVVVAVDPYTVPEIERARLATNVGPAIEDADGEAAP